MLIEIRGSRNSIVIDILDEYSKELEDSLPFKSRANIWKEELYFSIPRAFSVKGKPVRCHDTGKVYYWPPEKALCIFYGISEPYTDVYLVGEYIGPLHIVRNIRDGEELIVERHEVSPEFEDYAKVLRDLGYKVASPKIAGEDILVASKYIDNVRIAVSFSIEPYGIYIESEPLYKYSHEFLSRTASLVAKRLVRERFTSVRLDITEDNYVCITGVAKDLSEMRIVVREIEQAYRLVLEKVLLEFIAMPRAKAIHSI